MIRCEELEARRLLSDPATIVWSNRASTTAGGAGDTDGFGAAFGALATTARTVVDTVIQRFDRMIGSFNYPTSGTTYGLSLSATSPDGTFSGSGAVISTSGGKPVVGAVSIAGGSNDGIADNDNGWFIDTTPTDNSEFLGTLVNAFAGDAQTGSAAQSKPDFYTAVEHQMLKAMGMTSSLSGWSAHTADTGVADTANGVGNLWVFTGPSVKHLMSSDSDGVDAHAANRSAPVGDSITFGGNSYIGAADIGNGAAPLGRRYLLDTPFALMLKDAYGYSTLDPASIETFYSVLNTTTHALTVRGGDFGTDTTTLSADNLDLNTIVTGQYQMTIDIGTDVAGTGASSGANALGAFVQLYSPSSVTSISLQTGRGNDAVSIRGLGASVSCSINLGSEDDSVSIGNGDYDARISGPISIMGGTGFDSVSIDDSSSSGSNPHYFVTSTGFNKGSGAFTTWTGVEGISGSSSSTSDQVNIQSLNFQMSVFWNGNNGGDTFNIGSGTTIAPVVGAVTVIGGAGYDVLNLNDSGSSSGTVYNVLSTSAGKAGAAGVTYDSTLDYVSLSASTGSDTIAVQSGSTGPAVSVNSGAGADNVYVITSGFTSPVDWSLFVDGGTDSSFDTVSFLIGGVPGEIYALQSTNIYGNSLPTVFYSHFDAVHVNGSFDDDTILVYSTAEAISTTIDGGGGNDTIDMGGGEGILGGPFVLDNIAGPVTVEGNSGSDTLVFNDASEASSEQYHISDTAITRDDMADVSYSNCEGLSFIGGTDSDEFDIDSTNANAPVTIAGNDGVDSFFDDDNAAGTFVTIDGGPGLDTVAVNGDSFGSATIHFRNSQDLASLTISSGGLAVMEQNGARLLVTNSLSILGSGGVSSTGKLDLNDNDMLIDYTNQSPYSSVSNWIKTARNTGTWDGSTGITSTSASTANPRNTTLGILESKDWLTLYPGTTFDAHGVDNTMVLVKYTYYGDANFNGKVDGADYAKLDFGFGQHLAGWINGDFNGDGKVNGADYGLIDYAFGTQGHVVLRSSATSDSTGTSRGDLTRG